jgi:hypothetical protein
MPVPGNGQPDTSSFGRFVRSCQKYNMDYWMAVFVTCQVTIQQKGLMALLRGEILDLYRLDEVPGVSHTDLYSRYLPQARAQAEAAAVDGQITLQDLVAIKEWIAKQEKVGIMDSSKIETALLFVRAGGNLQTGKVGVADVFTLLQGQRPTGDGEVNFSTLNRARGMARWSK